jgi:hypothetical protein
MAGGATMGCHRSSRTGFVIVPAGPAQTGEREFYVGGAPGMSCYIDAPRMACQYHSAAGEQKATLSRHGGLRACRWVGGAGGECGLGNPGEGTPTYKAGRVVAFAGYRCEIVAAGVRCVVAASGKGFEMTPDGVAAVGGAILVPELPQAQEVLSSDHLVWCGVDTDVNALTCSTADFSHVGDVDGYGTIAICNDGSLACTHEFHASAPVIAPGAQAELSGYRCTAAADGDGIACVEPRTGRGVMVTSGAASAIG